MPLPTRGRSQYDPVTTNEEEDQNTSLTEEANPSQPSIGRRRNNNNNTNTNYSRIIGVAEDATLERVSKEDTPLKVDADADDEEAVVKPATTLDVTPPPVSADDELLLLEKDDGNRINVVVLDSAQNRFSVKANPEWTILSFKKVGVKTHKVPPPSQRLIFRGKMLDDSKTLKEVGIEKDDIIVHLFPKPRVVMTNSSNVSNESSNDTDDGGGGGGAHVPQILLDQEEQERRGQILVLGSVEIAEAQNNVKLLSLLLLVVCAMRLLALFSIAMGVAEEPIYDDDLSPSSSSSHHNNHTTEHTDLNGQDYQVRAWENQDYFDFLVSGIGFYVATLGMKATTENTLRLANAYCIGTVIAGILWNCWNMFMYTMFVQEETSSSSQDNGVNVDDDRIPLTQDDFVTVAFFSVGLPLMVWGLCCTRAWQFRQLIEEAEQEAAERIRSQLTLTEGDNDDDNTNANARELTELSSSSRPTIV
jgi:hypothetical protein